MTNQNDIVASLTCDEAYLAFKYTSCLGSFCSADVDAVVVDGYFFLCRMLAKSIFSCYDALLNRIWQLAFVLREVVGELISNNSIEIKNLLY